MKSKARLGTFEDLLSELHADTTDNVRPIATRLREIVFAGCPDAVEVVRLGDGASCIGVGPKKMSEAHVYIMPLKARVNLGFFHGANVPDPHGLLEGTGKKLRHVKIKTMEDANKPEIEALIAAALTERKAALGLT